MKTSLWRSRWAAIGAAVAVTMGLGGVSLVSASPPEADPVTVTINPCRLVDTRPGSTVGPRGTRLGHGETMTVQVAGASGNCNLPADALAVVANVTALGPSLASDITVWPTGQPRPTTTNLNTRSGQPPTPNLVISDIGAGGSVDIYNDRGDVNLTIDVSGYTVDHDHDGDYLSSTGGSVTGAISAPAFNLATTRIETVSISDAAFQGRSSLIDTISTLGQGGAYITNLNGQSDGLVAEIQLPDGARLVGLTAHFFDDTSAGGANLTARLWSQSATGGFFVTVGEVSTFAGGGLQTRSTSLNHVVNNETNAYTVFVSGALDSDRRIRSVEIDYEVTGL